LREAISKTTLESTSKNKSQPLPEDFLVAQGGMEGIFCVLNALLQPDDHVISHFPVYPGLWLTAQNKGCTVSFWQGTIDTGWIPDLTELDSLCQSNTKALIVNFPHNPTGALPETQWWQSLFDWAEARRIFIISDEVYRWSEHDPAKRLPPAFLMSPWGISISSLSKAFGLAGLRLGWVGCKNPELLEKIAQQKDFTSLTPNSLSEWTAAWALKNHQIILEHGLETVLKQKALLESHLNQFNSDYPGKSLQWHSPETGALLSVLLPTGNTSKDLTEAFLSETGGLVLSSHLYYPAENYLNRKYSGLEFIRLSFGHQKMADQYPLFFNFIKTNIF
jgi:aspartate/methionine/tyrosine aminotransferase